MLGCRGRGAVPGPDVVEHAGELARRRERVTAPLEILRRPVDELRHAERTRSRVAGVQVVAGLPHLHVVEAWPLAGGPPEQGPRNRLNRAARTAAETAGSAWSRAQRRENRGRGRLLDSFHRRPALRRPPPGHAGDTVAVGA